MLPVSVLKYVGLVVAVVSAVWALFHRPIAEDASGRRRLTRAGTVTLGLLGAGFVVSALSTYLEGRQAAESRRAAAESQHVADRGAARRKPLHRLVVEWSFAATSGPARGATRASGCPNDFESPRAAPRLTELYPWLAGAPGTRGRVQGVVVVLPLDARAAYVLPLGMVQLPRAKEEDPLPTSLSRKQLLSISATVEFREDLEQCLDRNDRYTRPAVERLRRCPLKASLERAGERVTARWELDATCIAKGVDRQAGADEPTGEFPERMVVAVLTEMAGLPFEPANFAEHQASLPFDRVARGAETSKHRSTLRLVANDAEADASVYELWFQRTEQMGGKSGGAEVRTDFPQMKTWVGRRVEGRPARGQ
jgi:hypothetical protein